jgi:hypothetical protein
MWTAFVGLLLVALGALLLLERLGIVERAFAVWWPVFLIVLGVVLLIRALVRWG